MTDRDQGQQSQEDRVIQDVHRKIEREKIIIQGAKSVKASTNNQSVQQKCDSNIREAQKNIAYLEQTLKNVKLRMSGSTSSSSTNNNGQHQHSTSDVSTSSNTSAPDGSSGSKPADDSQTALDHPLPPVPSKGEMVPKVRPNYTRLDLLMYDTPYLGPRIQLMLQQLEFKLSVEKQYKEGIEKMLKLYQMEGDRRSKAEAETKLVESTNKIQLLKKASKRYSDMHIFDVQEDVVDDNESLSSPNMRRPLSGNLHIACLGIKDVDHVATNNRFSRVPESMITIKVEDQTRGRTRFSRNERWMEEFDFSVDKASEIELVVYDRSGDQDIPVALMWLRLSDIAEALRRKRVENEIQNNKGWVSASRVRGDSTGSTEIYNNNNDDTKTNANFNNSSSNQSSPSTAVGSGSPASAPTSQNRQLTVDAWFVLEPVGQIRLSLGFEKTNRGLKRTYDGVNGLGRQGAIRQKKEEVHEVHGHKFVQQQFYNIMRCALCGDFLKYSAGFQCQDCRLTCHKKCYQKVVTKCISKASTESDPDEEKLNHRIPHRFGPSINMSANWCCHCGYILPLGKKNVRKCSECGLTCHPQCAHLVPDFCGMPMETANQILSEIKSTKIRKQSAATTTTQPNRQPRQPLDTRTPAEKSPYMHRNSYTATSPLSVAPPPPPPKKEPVRRKEVGSAVAPAPFAPAPASQMDSEMPSPEATDVTPSPSPVSIGSHEAPIIAAMPIVPSPPTPPQASYNQQATLPVTPQNRDPASFASGAAAAAAAAYSRQQIPSPVQTDKPGSRLSIMPENTTTSPGLVPVKSKRRVGLDDFNFVAVLGRGNFGKVMLAESKNTRQLYAIKVLKKDFILESDEVEGTRSEKRIFLIANRERHPFLINLHSCFQTENRIYFVMEYISGGDLMWHIQKELFSYRRAQFYAAEVLLALKYFHDNGVIYRDLKLDNILLTLDGHIKIADYGLCKEDMWYGRTTGTFCGTPDFMAPEIILDQKYGRAVDWWAFGVLIYQMLLGKSPFRGEDDDEVFDAILSDEPLYPINMPRNSVSILQALLTRDPEKRLGSGPKDAEDVMAHPYFDNINFDDIYHCRVAPPFVPSISSPTDVSNFDKDFTNESPALTPVNSVLTPAMQEKFRGFSYMSGDAV